MKLFLLLFCLLPPVSQPETYNCDTIEVNSKYDDEGRWTFDQLIFWDRLDYIDDNREHVIGWKLLKNSRKHSEKDRLEFEDKELAKPIEHRLNYIPPEIPHPWMPKYENKRFVSRIYDNGKLYYVKSTAYKRSHTQSDPELNDRDFLPINERPFIPLNRNSLTEPNNGNNLEND